MRAHLIQMDLAWEDRTENHRRLSGLLERVSGVAGSGDLVALPEMFDTGFSFNLARTADSDGKTLGFLCDCARRYGITLHGSRSVVGADGRGRNRATIVGPDGSVLVEYDKIHPFSFGRESEFFSGGSSVVTYEWRSGRDSILVCPAICYDLRFPELFRIGLQKGAEMFVLGANWPAPRKVHRRVLSMARAIENQAFMLSINRSGRDPHLDYAGESLAVGPTGDVIAEGGTGEEILTVEIDPGAVRAWREKFPAWRDLKLAMGGV
jgi:predicted amidohydrolase